MPLPLVQTKFFLPHARPDDVARPRLLEQLQEGVTRGRGLTLLSAPAGYGKTTMIARWMMDLAHPADEGPRDWRPHIAWLSLDEDDNDPARFMIYVVAALERVDEALGQSTIRLLANPQLPPPSALVAPLVNELTAWERPLFFVLDDYHVIQHPTVHTLVQYLLDHQPPLLHLVLSTRVDPPLNLSRLRVRDRLTELRASDLRFDSAEIDAFLETGPGAVLSSDQRRILARRTEGWAAGLQLARLALRNRDDVDEFVRAFGGSHLHIIDYLTEEVLSRQPDTIRHFLRETAVLERFNADLCAAVTDRTDCRSLLRQLREQNLFLVSLDSTGTWFRYHHLLAEYLRAELSAEKRRHLHLRAAQWLAAHDRASQAIKHALSSREFDFAADLILSAANDAMQGGQLTILRRWLEALPAQTLTARPDLGYFYAWALYLLGELDAAKIAIDTVSGAAPSATPALFHAMLRSLRAWIALSQSDIETALHQAAQAQPDLVNAPAHIRGANLLVLAQVRESMGNSNEAIDAFSRAADVSGPENPLPYATALFGAGQLLAVVGRPQEARAAADQIARTLTPPFGGIALGIRALLAYETANLPPAAEWGTKGIDYCEQTGVVTVLLGSKLYQIRTLLAQGALQEVETLLDEARSQALANHLPQYLARFAGLQARLWLARGDVAAAAGWIDTLELPTATQNSFLVPAQFNRIRVRLAQRQWAAAATEVAQLGPYLEKSGREAEQITLYMLQAQLAQGQSRQEEAQRALQQALDLAAPLRYWQRIIQDMDGLSSLLLALPDGPAALVTKIGEQLNAPDPAAEQPPALADPLTVREQEILALIAAGLSNSRIAEELVITVGTTRWHITNLYSKLGVKNRIQAVKRAQELNLL